MLSRSLLSTVLLLTTVFSSLASQPQRTALAASGQILWGAWVGDKPLEPARLDAFEQMAGKRPSIIHWGQPWFHANKYVPFQSHELEAVRNRGAIPMLDWFSWDYCCGPNQPDFQLADVIGGKHDAFVVQWAQAARAWGHPFFVRFNAEMNGWWLPWSEQVNGNQSGEFVRAWRHVVDLVRAQGADNVNWVWCPNVSGPRTTPLAGLYPGDSYVEWTCMDGYNFGLDLGGEWQTFEQVFAGSAYNGYRNTYQEVIDLAPNKPMMIGEIGTSRDGGDPEAWVRDALTRQLPEKFPQIQALVWFSWNAGDPSLDWPIESSPAIQRGFASGIASPYFATNEFRDLPAPRIAPLTDVAQPAPARAAATPQVFEAAAIPEQIDVQQPTEQVTNEDQPSEPAAEVQSPADSVDEPIGEGEGP